MSRLTVSLGTVISILLTFLKSASSVTLSEDEKTIFCKSLNCSQVKERENVCGLRKEREGFRLRSFENECSLLKFGCQVAANETYGLTSSRHCDQVIGSKEIYKGFFSKEDKDGIRSNMLKNPKVKKTCTPKSDCSGELNATEICAIRKHEDGFKIRLFSNNCELVKHNCEKLESSFSETDFYICQDLQEKDKIDVREILSNKTENVVVIHVESDNMNDANESISNFFADTHDFPLPLQEMAFDNPMHKSFRRMRVRNAAGVKVFTPSVTIPIEKLNDSLHLPTINSCYHKCPTVCPDTYSPVCASPGTKNFEPSIVFKNHCLMDIAQCKVYNENKSPTARMTAYVETAFVFCLGVQLHGLYRFLPVLRSLQHMGRMKKRGHRFHYKIRNMRFWNNYIARNPSFMG